MTCVACLDRFCFLGLELEGFLSALSKHFGASEALLHAIKTLHHVTLSVLWGMDLPHRLLLVFHVLDSHRHGDVSTILLELHIMIIVQGGVFKIKFPFDSFTLFLVKIHLHNPIWLMLRTCGSSRELFAVSLWFTVQHRLSYLVLSKQSTSVFLGNCWSTRRLGG